MHWRDFGIPLPIVEVLSPSTAVHDRNLKRRKYQTSGVGEYWIVDLDARHVERWRPGDAKPEVLTERIAWQPDTAVPALTLQLPSYFRDALSEG